MAPEQTEFITISQNVDGELVEIVTLAVDPKTFWRISKMPICLPTDNPIGSVWIDQVDDDYNIVSDAPLHVKPYHGKWLIEEFFRLHPKYAKKIKG